MKHLYAYFTITVCTTLGIVNLNSQELHSHSNAVSIANESNATIGWSGNSTITADTSDPFHGTYAMKVVSTGVVSTNRRVEYTYSATIGETYNISIWAKTGSQTLDPAFASWTGVTGFTNPTLIATNGIWTEYTFTVIATSTSPLILIYIGSSSGSVGDELYIDSVSITPQSSADVQSPTAPTLSSTGHGETTADLLWSGATDNVGVTGYNIYKDGSLEANCSGSPYTITGLSASTTYSFTVTALDAVGNESTVSNVVPVTTDAPSGGGSSVWSEANSIASYTGDVGIGTSTVPTGYKLAVNGKIISEELKVQLQSAWPDYVFKKDYKLLTLEEIEKHIQEKGHLPNMPSAKEVEANGLEVGEMNRLLLEKIEEQMLYIIELKKENDKMVGFEKRIKKIEKKLKHKQ
nr:fibronectin type III domain-containing protein [uncultured Allomuricauda sp.]